MRVIAPSILVYLWVIGYGAYLLAALLGLLPYPRQGMIGGLLMVLMFPWVFTLLRLFSARQFRGYIEVLVSTSGLQIRAGKAVGSIAWEAIPQGFRLRDGILLLQAGHMYRWLPDSALQNAVPPEVVELLKSHVALDVRA